MSLTSTTKNPYLVYGFYFLFSLWFTGTWINTADAPLRSFEPPDGSGLTALVDGTAPRPYVQRALIPYIVRSMKEFLPSGGAESITATLAGSAKVQKEASRLMLRTDRLFDYALVFGLTVICVFVLVIALRSLIGTLFNGHHVAITAFPMLALLLLPAFFTTGPHYLYDLPAVMFFILGLTLMVRREWWWYYPVFVLGCLNKETMILLTVPFITLFMKEMSAQNFKNHLVFHVLIGGGVIAFLWSAFSRNPGAGVEFHLFANLHQLMSGYSVQTVMFITGVFILIAHGWRSVPPSLGRIASVVVPYLFVWALFGLFYEPRAIYEVLILAGIFLVHAIFRTLARLNINPSYNTER